MVQKVLSSQDPRLREVSKPVKKIDKKVLDLIKDLKDTLSVQKDPEGVGLAAPQIGKNLRVFLISYQDTTQVVINPEIIKVSAKKRLSKEKGGGEIMEGCLSLPNFYGPLSRASSVKIKYLNEKDEERVEEFKGFFAQIVLHEIDHLEGILFIDRLLSEKKPLYRLDGKEWHEVDLI